MENNRVRQHTHWTWADLVSSYRFWALIVCSCIIGLNTMIFTGFLFHMIRDYAISNRDISMMMSIGSMGRIFAIIPAWIASRTNSHYGLYIFTLVIILAFGGMYIAGDNLLLIIVFYFIINLFSAAAILFIAGLIAKALDSVEFYIIIFGLIAILTFVGQLFYPFSTQALLQKYNYSYEILFLAHAILMGIVILLLLPIRTLFNQSPVIRTVHCEKSQQHDSFVVFILSTFIPFYVIYWFVRSNHDIRNYSQSAKLLTPTGAGWCAFLVPLAMPIMLLSLNDVIDEQQNMPKRSYCGFILVSIFLLPIAIAMTQSRLNKLEAQEMR